MADWLSGAGSATLSNMDIASGLVSGGSTWMSVAGSAPSMPAAGVAPVPGVSAGWGRWVWQCGQYRPVTALLRWQRLQRCSRAGWVLTTRAARCGWVG